MKTKMMMLLAAVCMAITVNAKDIKTVVLTTNMHCANCAKNIYENVRFEKGVTKITTDVKTKKVTITYDAEKTTVDKLIKSIEKLKYTAKVAE